MRMTGVRSAAALLLPAAGCAAVPQTVDYSAFRAADPHSVLILPAVNRSTSVDVPALVLGTFTIPVAERGYYVFPVGLVKGVLEDEAYGKDLSVR